MALVIFTLLMLCSFFLTFVLTVFFAVTKKGFSIENKILSALLVVFNLQILYSFCTSNYAFMYFMEWHKPIYLIKQTSFLIGPLIYFYVNLFLKRKESLAYRNLLHFIPFGIVILILMVYYFNTGRYIIWLAHIDIYFTVSILLHTFIYIVLSVLSMKSANLSLRSFYHNIKIASHNTWLQFILLGFILIWAVNLNSFATYMVVRRPEWCAYTVSIYALAVFLFANAIMFVVLLNPDIYYKVTKYKNTKIKEDDKSVYLERLNAFMEKNKPYLNPEITLECLANEIQVNPRTLSQIINETYNKNFKTFILEYRIKESMQILANPNYKKLTVLEILYQVGFNSKSTFNNQFKLFTELTPQEYRLKHLN